MKESEVRKLNHGLYRIYWKEEDGGGTSLAAVGVTSSGGRWLAPTNWVNAGTGKRSEWRSVKRVELIKE